MRSTPPLSHGVFFLQMLSNQRVMRAIRLFLSRQLSLAADAKSTISTTKTLPYSASIRIWGGNYSGQRPFGRKIVAATI
jgi:hypothetical protein